MWLAVMELVVVWINELWFVVLWFAMLTLSALKFCYAVNSFAVLCLKLAWAHKKLALNTTCCAVTYYFMACCAVTCSTIIAVIWLCYESVCFIFPCCVKNCHVNHWPIEEKRTCKFPILNSSSELIIWNHFGILSEKRHRDVLGMNDKIINSLKCNFANWEWYITHKSIKSYENSVWMTTKVNSMSVNVFVVYQSLLGYFNISSVYLYYIYNCFALSCCDVLCLNFHLIHYLLREFWLYL